MIIEILLTQSFCGHALLKHPWRIGISFLLMVMTWESPLCLATDSEIGPFLNQLHQKAHSTSESPWKEQADAVLIQNTETQWERYLKAAMNLPDWVDLGLENRTRFEVYDHPWRSSQLGGGGKTDPQVALRSRMRFGLYGGPFNFLFEGQDSPEHLLAVPPLIAELNARQIEAVAWREDHIFLTNEQREIFELPPSRWRNQNAPFLRRPEVSVPWVPGRPSVHIPLDKWARGEWLEVRLEAEPARIVRAIWSPEGLHIGVELPPDITLHHLELDLSNGFDDWFLPGILYLMINPDGARPIAYGANDRCRRRPVEPRVPLNHKTFSTSARRTS